MMKSRLMTLSFLLALGAFAAGPFDNAVLHGETDKARATEYAVGEPIVFRLSFQGAKPFEKGSYSVVWKRTGDDGVVEQEKVDAADFPIEVKTKMEKPGFVRLEAYLKDKDGKNYMKSFTGDATTPEGREAMNRFEKTNKAVFFDGGAGVEIGKLRQAKPEPADFDAYQAELAKRLAAVPIKAELKPIPYKNPKVKAYAVRIACAGPRPVTGYLYVPAAADEGKKFPARLETHGYSYRPPHQPAFWYNEYEIALNINAHGMDLPAFGATKEYYDKLGEEIKSNGQIYAFDPIQNANRDEAYFCQMFLRVKRALQYLKSLPGWDGKTLKAVGGSQGGLQTIWAAGCGEGVTVAESTITWCCDLGGETIGRNRGGWYIRWADGLGYYDAVNFAKRIPKTCRTTIPRAGLGDYTCPPSGLAILYNNMTCPKKIVWEQGSQHGYVPSEPHARYSDESDFAKK